MPKRLTLVIHALHGGGAEKTVARMASYWAERGEAVTLITLDSHATDVFHVSHRVERVALDLMRTSSTIWQALINTRERVRQLRRAIAASQPDCVVSFTDKMNVLTLMACRPVGATRRKPRMVVVERTDPRVHAVGRAWSLLRRRWYSRSDAIVAQTGAIRDFLREFAGRTPVYVVPNCLWPESIPAEMPPLLSRRRRIVGLGRLAAEKDFTALLGAFRQIHADHADWDLVIIGEGPLRNQLQQQIHDAGLEHRARLLGWLADPWSVLLDAQVFVLPSQYEGFPNALLEAMACGLAPISFDCESGPREIIRHEVDGLLVPPSNVAQLATAMRRLLSDEALRLSLAARAVEVRERFGIKPYFARWDEILAPTAS